MRKHLICLIDGTMVSAAHTQTSQSYSNIFELACLLQTYSENLSGEPQIVFYRSGISSQPDSRSYLNAATGNSILSQIVDQYTNICSNYNFNEKKIRNKDKIYLFGFSRGAMAVRALSGIISEFGLLSPKDIFYLPELISAWQNNEGRSNLSKLIKLQPATIEFIGLFDSVMGGIEVLPAFNPVRFNEYAMSQQCRRGLQILAIDESRPHFKPKLWTGINHNLELRWEGKTRLLPRRKWMRQIWMPGSHSDVGGTGNALFGAISLASMVYFIKKGTSLSLNDQDIEDIEHRIRISIPSRKFKISKSYFNVFPNRKIVSQNDEQYIHPICEIVENCKYNFHFRKTKFYRKYAYNWKKNVFEKHISGKIEHCNLLRSYFFKIT